jgi:hypothetical protein
VNNNPEVSASSTRTKRSAGIGRFYVAAHEIGHLLLGGQVHSKQGLMKADWSSDDYLAMAQNRFHFSIEQTRDLARRYGSSDQVHGEAGTAIATQP